MVEEEGLVTYSELFYSVGMQMQLLLLWVEQKGGAACVDINCGYPWGEL